MLQNQTKMNKPSRAGALAIPSEYKCSNSQGTLLSNMCITVSNQTTAHVLWTTPPCPQHPGGQHKQYKDCLSEGHTEPMCDNTFSTGDADRWQYGRSTWEWATHTFIIQLIHELDLQQHMSARHWTPQQVPLVMTRNGTLMAHSIKKNQTIKTYCWCNCDKASSAFCSDDKSFINLWTWVWACRCWRYAK